MPTRQEAPVRPGTLAVNVPSRCRPRAVMAPVGALAGVYSAAPRPAEDRARVTAAAVGGSSRRETRSASTASSADIHSSCPGALGALRWYGTDAIVPCARSAGTSFAAAGCPLSTNEDAYRDQGKRSRVVVERRLRRQEMARR